MTIKELDRNYLKWRDSLTPPPPPPPENPRRKGWEGPDCRECRYYDYWPGEFLPLLCCDNPAMTSLRDSIPRERQADWAEIFIHRGPGGMCEGGRLFAPITRWQRIKRACHPMYVLLAILLAPMILTVIISAARS